MNFSDHYLMTEMAAGKIDTKEFIPGSKYSLEKRFDYWNKKLFGNKLPKPILKMATISAAGVMITVSDRRTKILANPENWVLKVNPKGKRTMEGWDAILIHEMIHLFWDNEFLGQTVMAYRKYLGRDGHGEPFVKKVDEINKKIPFIVALSDELGGMDNTTPLKKEIFYMVFEHKPGKFAALLFNKNVPDDPRVKDMVTGQRDVYLGNNINFGAGFTNDAGLTGVTVKTKWPKGRSVNWVMIPDEVGQRLIARGFSG